MSRKPNRASCERCGLERVVRDERTNLCRSCRSIAPGAHQAWMEHASCTRIGMNPEWWYPKAESDPNLPHAILICRSCVVRDLCLDFALYRKEDHGIWGGHTPAERKAILASQRRAQRSA